MSDDPLLMIPGPVSLSEPIRDAMAREMISHRSPAFEEIYHDCQEALGAAFGTDDDIVLINGSGTAAMETAVSNVVGPDDAVVCVKNGYFSDRFEQIAERYTTDVRLVTTDWGTPLDVDQVANAVTDDVRAVTMVHADTATGLVNPIGAVAESIAETDAVLIVDCITSVACEDVQIDEWNVDIAVTASQKALGSSPGVSALTVSDHAKQSLTSNTSAYYLDLSSYLENAVTHQTPTTSPVTLYRGLHEALQQFAAEGLRERISRHAAFARALRNAGTAMGLAPYPDPDHRSKYTNAVTVLELPYRIDAETVVTGMSERGILIRSGLGKLQDDTIRIGTMGDLGANDILRTVDALQSTLREHGVDGQRDAVVAAETVLQ